MYFLSRIGDVVLYEFLAWLQEQEHFWKMEEPIEEAHEPALPHQLAETHEPDISGPYEAEASGGELAQVRATARSAATDVGLSNRLSLA